MPPFRPPAVTPTYVEAARLRSLTPTSVPLRWVQRSWGVSPDEFRLHERIERWRRQVASYMQDGEHVEQY